MKAQIKKNISIIVAIAENNAIGKDNQLPWHLPADLAWFKKTTMGKPIIMGRKTHESIGKPLPGRQNIIISTNPDLSFSGCDVVNSAEAAIALVKDDPELMVIGGALIYQLFFPLVDRLYITRVHAEIAGDTFFPDYESIADWKLGFNEDHPADDRNAYPFSFQQLDKITVL